MPITVEKPVEVKADLAAYCECVDFAYRSRSPQTREEFETRLKNATGVAVVSSEVKYGIVSCRVRGKGGEYVVTLSRSDVAPPFVCKHVLAVLLEGLAMTPPFDRVEVVFSERGGFREGQPRWGDPQNQLMLCCGEVREDGDPPCQCIGVRAIAMV